MKNPPARSEYLKSQHPHSEVAVKDLASGTVTAAVATSGCAW